MEKRKYLSVMHGLPEPYLNINIMTAEPGFALAPHAHEFFHLNRIVTGSVEIMYDGTCHTLTAGQIFLLPPDKNHALESPDGYTQIGIDIAPRGELAKEFFSLGGGFMYTRAVSQAEISRMRSLLLLPTTLNRMRAVNLAESQAIEFLEQLRDERGDPFVKAFGEMAAQHDVGRLRLDDMCRILCLSRTQLERRSHAAFGCGASEYCARLRYARVCELLHSDRTLEAIASEAGFCDACHLSRFFAARAGMTPGEYRSKYR